MPKIPDKIVNKTARDIQYILFFVAGLMGLGAMASLSNGEGGGGMLFLAVLIGTGASMIKTTYHHKGSKSIYK